MIRPFKQSLNHLIRPEKERQHGRGRLSLVRHITPRPPSMARSRRRGPEGGSLSNARPRRASERGRVRSRASQTWRVG